MFSIKNNDTKSEYLWLEEDGGNIMTVYERVVLAYSGPVGRKLF